MDGCFALALGDGAHQGGIQPAGQQETHLGVGHQPLLHSGDELLAQVAAEAVQLAINDLAGMGHVPVTDKLAVLVIMPRREGYDLSDQAHQTLGLAGEDDNSLGVIAIVERADANRVPGGNEPSRLPIVENAGELGVQHGKHVHSVLPVHGQQDLAIRAALEGIALGRQSCPQPPKAVYLAVADAAATVQREGLHPLGVEAHNGQPVKAQQALSRGGKPGVVRPPGLGLPKGRFHTGKVGRRTAVTDDRTHSKRLFSASSALKLPSV